MTIAPPDPATLANGTRVVLGGGVRFVESHDTGVREVEARICSYDVGPDSYGTTWKPGWAADGLRDAISQGRAIPMVFGHDERNLANIVGSVAGFDDKPDGLYVRMRMANFDEVPSARSAYSLIRDGHIPGWSFKYTDGRTVADPQHRGALQFTRARLVHVSPVIDPSIPGTATVGVRSEQQEDEMDAAAIAAAVKEGIAEGLRAAGLAPKPEEPPDPKTLALSVAGAFTAACALFDQRSVDVDGLGELGQVLTAGAVAADELCDALGVDASDVRAAAEQATVSAGERAASKTPYGDVEYADPGYQSDKKKRYPLNTAEHVKAALSYIAQGDNASQYSAEQLAEIKGRIAAAAKKFGIEVSDDDGDEGKRSTDDGDDFDAELEAARAILERR